MHPKTLFLIDALGATLTALILGSVGLFFEGLFGMPSDILLILAWIALVYAFFSYSKALKPRTNWKKPLRTIAVMNFAYCVVTISLLIFFRKELSLIGWVYFFFELIIICILAIAELRASTDVLLHHQSRIMR